MAVAPSAVFGVAELLERVLLADELNYKNLFVLQRVNKFFENTIQGSKKLKRKMFLIHALTAPATFVPGDAFPMFTQLKMRAWLKLLPFKYLGLLTKYRGSQEVSGGTRDEKPEDFTTPPTLQLSVMCRDSKRDHPSSDTGVKSTKDYRVHGIEGSWSRMLLTGHRTACRVNIEVGYQATCPGNYLKFYHYFEIVEITSTAEYTLADLFQFLEEIYTRNKEQHLSRAHRDCHCIGRDT